MRQGQRHCIATEGKIEAAKRFEVFMSEGNPSTEEMPYLAEMLNGKIELVDLEPACPMTTYGDEGPVLFRIAHQNIAHNSSDVCDHWVLIDMRPNESKEARMDQDVEARLHGKKKPRQNQGA